MQVQNPLTSMTSTNTSSSTTPRESGGIGGGHSSIESLSEPRERVDNSSGWLCNVLTSACSTCWSLLMGRGYPAPSVQTSLPMTPIPPNVEEVVNQPSVETVQFTQSFLGAEQGDTSLQKLSKRCKGCLLTHLGEPRLKDISLDKECKAAILIRQGEKLIGTYYGVLTKDTLADFKQKAIEKMQNTLAAQPSVSEITISTLVLENPEQKQSNLHQFTSTIGLSTIVSVNGIENQKTKGELVGLFPTYYGTDAESRRLGVPVSQFFLGVATK